MKQNLLSVAALVSMQATLAGFECSCSGGSQPDSIGLSSFTADGASAAQPSSESESESESDQASDAVEVADGVAEGGRDLHTQSCTGVAADSGGPGTCSGQGGAPSSLAVHNGCGQSVDAWSVTPPVTCPTCCAEIFVRTIPAGQSLTLAAVASQVWRLRLPDAGPVLVEVPPLGAGTTTVVVP
jgi:hypothetical protein